MGPRSMRMRRPTPPRLGSKEEQKIIQGWLEASIRDVASAPPPSAEVNQQWEARMSEIVADGGTRLQQLKRYRWMLGPHHPLLDKFESENNHFGLGLLYLYLNTANDSFFTRFNSTDVYRKHFLANAQKDVILARVGPEAGLAANALIQLFNHGHELFKDQFLDILKKNKGKKGFAEALEEAIKQDSVLLAAFNAYKKHKKGKVDYGKLASAIHYVHFQFRERPGRADMAALNGLYGKEFVTAIRAKAVLGTKPVKATKAKLTNVWKWTAERLQGLEEAFRKAGIASHTEVKDGMKKWRERLAKLRASSEPLDTVYEESADLFIDIPPAEAIKLVLQGAQHDAEQLGIHYKGEKSYSYSITEAWVGRMKGLLAQFDSRAAHFSKYGISFVYTAYVDTHFGADLQQVRRDVDTLEQNIRFVRLALETLTNISNREQIDQQLDLLEQNSAFIGTDDADALREMIGNMAVSLSTTTDTYDKEFAQARIKAVEHALGSIPDRNNFRDRLAIQFYSAWHEDMANTEGYQSLPIALNRVVVDGGFYAFRQRVDELLNNRVIEFESRPIYRGHERIVEHSINEGNEVYSGFQSLSLETQYALYRLMEKKYGAAWYDMADSTMLAKFSMFVRGLRGFPPAYAALLIDKTGMKLMDHTPENINIFLRAITSYARVYIPGGHYRELGGYIEGLPPKLDKIFTDIFALKDEIKEDLRDVRIIIPPEQKEFAQLFFPAIRFRVNLPMHVYTRMIEPILPIEKPRAPDIQNIPRPAPSIVATERRVFDDRQVDTIVSVALPYILPPLAVNRLFILAPDHIPETGPLYQGMLTSTGFYHRNENTAREFAVADHGTPQEQKELQSGERTTDTVFLQQTDLQLRGDGKSAQATYRSRRVSHTEEELAQLEAGELTWEEIEEGSTESARDEIVLQSRSFQIFDEGESTGAFGGGRNNVDTDGYVLKEDDLYKRVTMGVNLTAPGGADTALYFDRNLQGMHAVATQQESNSLSEKLAAQARLRRLNELQQRKKSGTDLKKEEQQELAVLRASDMGRLTELQQRREAGKELSADEKQDLHDLEQSITLTERDRVILWKLDRDSAVMVNELMRANEDQRTELLQAFNDEATTENPVYHYTVYAFKRIDNGSFGLIDFRTMGKEEAERLYQITVSDFNRVQEIHDYSRQTADKLFVQAHPVFGSREDMIAGKASELELEGAVLFAGEENTIEQGVGAAYQRKGWGGYYLHEFTRGGRLSGGFGHVEPEDRSMWIGRLFVSDIEEIPVETEKGGLQKKRGYHLQGTYIKAEQTRVNGFFGMRDQAGIRYGELGIVLDFLTDEYYVGGGGFLRTSFNNFDLGAGRAYFIDRNLVYYGVISGLLKKAAQDEKMQKNLAAGGRYLFSEVWGVEGIELKAGGAWQSEDWKGGFLSVTVHEPGPLEFQSYEGLGVGLKRRFFGEEEERGLGIVGGAAAGTLLEPEAYWATGGGMGQLKLHSDLLNMDAALGAGSVPLLGRGVHAGLRYRTPKLTLWGVASKGSEPTYDTEGERLGGTEWMVAGKRRIFIDRDNLKRTDWKGSARWYLISGLSGLHQENYFEFSKSELVQRLAAQGVDSAELAGLSEEELRERAVTAGIVSPGTRANQQDLQVGLHGEDYMSQLTATVGVQRWRNANLRRYLGTFNLSYDRVLKKWFLQTLRARASLAAGKQMGREETLNEDILRILETDRLFVQWALTVGGTF